MTESAVIVYRPGGLSCSVCVPREWDRETVTREVNLAHPCGTEAGWAIARDATFAGGQPMPCPCDRLDWRMHWLMEA